MSKTLLVQFVGADREALRRAPELSVSVEKLRAAFRWLSLNSWPFMEATKGHSLWHTGALDPKLEALLQEYAQSVGGTQGGTPAELVQGASRIAPEHASVLASGPANCTPSEEQATLD